MRAVELFCSMDREGGVDAAVWVLLALQCREVGIFGLELQRRLGQGAGIDDCAWPGSEQGRM